MTIKKLSFLLFFLPAFCFGGNITMTGSGAGSIVISGPSASPSTALLGSTQTFSGQNTFRGTVVIGTTSTLATLGIVSNSTGTVGEILQGTVGQIADLQEWQNSSGLAIASISAYGHHNSTGTAPTLSTCGTSPSIAGDDYQGTVTIGGGVVTACTMTFAHTYNVTPTCQISDNSTAITGDISALSATAATFSFSASLGGGVVYYHCGCSGSSCQ